MSRLRAFIGILVIGLALVIEPFLLAAQEGTVPSQPPRIRVQSSLVLVDVITQDSKTGLPVRTLTKEDFRLFVDRRETPAATFATGGHYQARPVNIWLYRTVQRRREDRGLPGIFGQGEPVSSRSGPTGQAG